MKEKQLVTSVSLPETEAALWRAIRRFFSINYSADSEGWDASAGFLEEIITFWAVENPGDQRSVLTS